MFADLRLLASSATMVMFDTNLRKLIKRSSAFVGNVGFQVYFKREWESCINMWAAFYRQVGQQSIVFADLACVCAERAEPRTPNIIVH